MDNSRSSAHHGAMFLGGNRFIDSKTKRFDLGGFEPTKVTLAKREERQKAEQEKAERKKAAAKEAEKVVVKNANPTVPKVNEQYPPFRLTEVERKKLVPDGPRGDEQYVPLRPGESLWDPNMDPRRFSNILGGWGKPPGKWGRNK